MKTMTKATKGKGVAEAKEAKKLLAMIARVNHLRDELRELSNNPDIEVLAKLSPFDDDCSCHEIGLMDIPLHQIVDGAAIAYSRLMSNAKN